MEQLFLITGTVFLVLHEVDAVRCKEWRIFPGLSLLDEKTSKVIFHIGQIIVLLVVYPLLLTSHEPQIQRGFAVFMMIHFLLHVIYFFHPKNLFRDWISWSFITLAGISGTATWFSK